MTMQGPHQAKYFVNSYLEGDLPSRILTYRNAWNLDDEELPEPTRYLTYEPVAIDHWPMLITVAISMNGLERKEYTRTFDPQFHVEYAMRTYLWVKDNSSEQCTLKRDRLITVLRSAILDAPSLNRCSQSASDTLYARIDESGIREEYSELTLIKGERVMAGAYLSYNLTLNEVSTTAPIGNLSNFDIQEYSVAIQENFPE